MIVPEAPAEDTVVPGLVGVKVSETTVVTPPITVVYTYGIGAPGVPVVETGVPTGPCWTVWVETGA